MTETNRTITTVMTRSVSPQDELLTNRQHRFVSTSKPRYPDDIRDTALSIANDVPGRFPIYDISRFITRIKNLQSNVLLVGSTFNGTRHLSVIHKEL